ncbi:CPBP family intramembrane glutamic endopeptidase [Chitinimonas koreensis]|uniref:CPBP family intramembrane glutamic endopeptidase n=1 Tax=Chitinimonas koreensis TaxID=356302 RepID=UPI00048B135D|nr:type II CAAX endopeptidase family protein [Chitinimonas koreensis]
MSPNTRQPTSIPEIVLIVAIFAGWPVYASIQSVLSGFPVPRFTDDEALIMLLAECLILLAGFAVLRFRGWKLHDFGIQPSWLYSFAGVLLFGVAIVVEMALWDTLGRMIGGQEFLGRFGQSIFLSLPFAVTVSVVNGIFEEFFFCRYLVEAFAKHGAAVALGASALVRTLCHIYQGPLGAILILGLGVVITAFYWRFRKLWPAIFAHILADLYALS